MKNKVSFIILTLVAMLSVERAMAWGGWGHHITAYIAEKHLTPEAKAKCQHYLKHSLPHYSSWQDYWRNSDPFKEIHYWHMNYVDEGLNAVGSKGDLTRDAVTQIERISKEMLNGGYKNMSDSLVAVNLKLLIHMVGDMHCPCHVGYPKSMGLKGGAIYVKNKKYDRHKFWDSSPMLIHPKWKVDNFVKVCDTYTPKQIKKISKGKASKWGKENARKMVKTFYYWEPKEKLAELSDKQRNDINETMYEQLAYGGYRLANLLNKIFVK